MIAALAEKVPLTIEALCAVAGLSYNDLYQRVDGLPTEASGQWTPPRSARPSRSSTTSSTVAPTATSLGQCRQARSS